VINLEGLLLIEADNKNPHYCMKKTVYPSISPFTDAALTIQIILK